MPYKITKKKRGFDVDSPTTKHARGTTKKKAEAQVRLLNAIEHNPDFVPRKRKKKGSKAQY
jgi:hypothetical protein